jgi:chemotaxis protein methyltransferase CheR
MRETEIRNMEVSLFLEAMALRHGYDFRQYAKASIKRRVQALALAAGCRDIGQLVPLALRDNGFLDLALAHLSVPVTEMFRDPSVFLAIRRQVVPLLNSYPRVNIWQAGCATGEEPVSLAILLKEEGLLHKVQIYATDINDVALAKAEEGIYPTSAIMASEANYAKAGGKAALSDYFQTAYDFSQVSSDIREKIVFAHHNLVGDGVFCEENMVLCRNVLIYFDRDLQNRVLSLLGDSLARGGFLCLGTRESLHFTSSADQFSAVDAECRIFKKLGTGP